MGTQTKTLAEQVANGIMNLIQETPYKAGDKLPTEKELCERTGAGRNTVREALKILASRNVLEIRQGAGTFVSEKQGIPDDPLGFSMVNDHVKLTKDLLQVRIMLSRRSRHLRPSVQRSMRSKSWKKFWKRWKRQ